MRYTVGVILLQIFMSTRTLVLLVGFAALFGVLLLFVLSSQRDIADVDVRLDSQGMPSVAHAGLVTEVVRGNLAADVPASVRFAGSDGVMYQVILPGMELPNCASRAALALPTVVSPGDRVEVRGQKGEDGAIRPCMDKADYFRVIGTVSQSDVGMVFAYRKGPRGYRDMTPATTLSNHEHFVRGLVLVYEDDAEVANRGGAQEGPPAITVRSYRNPERLSAALWAAQHSAESNSNLVLGSATEAVVGGANAVTYRADGLYPSVVYVVAHGSYVHVFSAAYLDESAPQPGDLEAILTTVTFFPER